MPDIEAARALLEQAEMLCSAQQIEAALERLAREITARLGDSFPLLLSVMGGAVVFSGRLLPLLDFPLEYDCLQLSRYGSAQQGGALQWRVAPTAAVRGRTVLVLDDILDEGETLRAIRERVLALGAAACYSAVLLDKRHGRRKALHADFVGLELPDRFVFGYGMDIHGVWRNLPAIYAMKEE